MYWTKVLLSFGNIWCKEFGVVRGRLLKVLFEVEKTIR